MATTRAKFIAKCYEVVLAKPEYALGCSSLTRCDCIGMVKYGLIQNGVQFSSSGTNWTYRRQVDNIRSISSVNDLETGDVVFKLKKPGDDGYNLPIRYRQGGSDYNGDVDDYTHIGVVKSVNPLQIIHMTSPTAKTDTTIGRWARAAHLKSQYISDYGEPDGTVPIPQPDQTPAKGTAIVTGKAVALRRGPSTNAAVITRVATGSTVKIETPPDGWEYVNFNGKKGYMMKEFLKEG